VCPLFSLYLRPEVVALNGRCLAHADECVGGKLQ
jgi:hypothetical protein